MRLKTLKTTLRLCWSPSAVAELAAVPLFEVAQLEAGQQFEAAPRFVAVRSSAGEPLQPVAARIMAGDIVIRTTNIAAVAPMSAESLVAALPFIVAVRTHEVGLLPAAEAHMSPTAAVADAVANK
jgi:hypothetical protein